MFDTHDTTAATLRERILEGETTFGCWLTLGSSITAELVGAAGYDWALIDLEHGAGTESDALTQIQVLGPTRAAPLVRVESSARPRAGRVLDLWASVRQRLLEMGIGTPLTSNVAVKSFGDLPRTVESDAAQIVLCDHHCWGGMRQVQHLAKLCQVFGIGLSMHSNSHLGVSMM